MQLTLNISFTNSSDILILSEFLQIVEINFVRDSPVWAILQRTALGGQLIHFCHAVIMSKKYKRVACQKTDFKQLHTADCS